MSEKLKPCPFCGGPAGEMIDALGHGWARCRPCGVDYMRIEVWNRRELESASQPRGGESKPGDTLRWAAGIVQLYDDATMASDYMIDANDAEGILKALGEYVDRAAPSAGNGGAEGES